MLAFFPPAARVSVTVTGGTATALLQHMLTCMVTGVNLEVASAMVTYTWRRGSTILPSTSRQYVIPSAGVSDAGDDYLCDLTVSADYLDLTGSISASGSGTVQVQCKQEDLYIKCREISNYSLYMQCLNQ